MLAGFAPIQTGPGRTGALMGCQQLINTAVVQLYAFQQSTTNNRPSYRFRPSALRRNWHDLLDREVPPPVKRQDFIINKVPAAGFGGMAPNNALTLP